MSIHQRVSDLERKVDLLTSNFEERLGKAIDAALGELELISMSDIDRKREIELMEKLQKEIGG